MPVLIQLPHYTLFLPYQVEFWGSDESDMMEIDISYFRSKFLELPVTVPDSEFEIEEIPVVTYAP